MKRFVFLCTHPLDQNHRCIFVTRIDHCRCSFVYFSLIFFVVETKIKVKTETLIECMFMLLSDFKSVNFISCISPFDGWIEAIAIPISLSFGRILWFSVFQNSELHFLRCSQLRSSWIHKVTQYFQFATREWTRIHWISSVNCMYNSIASGFLYFFEILQNTRE